MRISLLLGLAWALAGCSGPDGKKINEPVQSIELIKSSFTIDRDKLSFCVLEEPDSLSIVRVDKLVVIDSLLFAGDVWGSSRILQFTHSGDFLSGLDKKGEDPDSYREISDFDVAKENGEYQVYVLSGARSANVYRDGDLFQTLQIPFNAQEIAKAGDDLILKLVQYNSATDSTNVQDDLLLYDMINEDYRTTGTNSSNPKTAIFMSNALAKDNSKVANSYPYSNIIKIYEYDTLERQLQIAHPLPPFDTTIFQKEYSNPYEELQAVNRQRGFHHQPNMHLDGNILISTIVSSGKGETKYFLIDIEKMAGSFWDKITFENRKITDLHILAMNEGSLYFESSMLQQLVSPETRLESKVIFWMPLEKL